MSLRDTSLAWRDEGTIPDFGRNKQLNASPFQRLSTNAFKNLLFCRNLLFCIIAADHKPFGRVNSRIQQEEPHNLGNDPNAKDSWAPNIHLSCDPD
jgi:hypothetical protein